MTPSPFNPDDEALRCLVEALTESGQAVSIFDAADNLRYANKTYQGMFLGNYDGPFTFTGITRHAHRNGLGVRIDDGDVEAFLARTLARRRCAPRKSFETDLVDGRWFWIDHTILPNGWILSVGADITTLKEAATDYPFRRSSNVHNHHSGAARIRGLSPDCHQPSEAPRHT
ncbi:hypothetical protein FS320_30060, partial [Microvirga tunisiensis]